MKATIFLILNLGNKINLSLQVTILSKSYVFSDEEEEEAERHILKFWPMQSNAGHFFLSFWNEFKMIYGYKLQTDLSKFTSLERMQETFFYK